MNGTNELEIELEAGPFEQDDEALGSAKARNW
jgi:hypothetical protein